MKKILIPVILGATVLALASCDSSSEEPQTTEEITITDDSGNEQTVEIEASEDETVVNNAVAYSLAADYSNVETEGIQIDINAGCDMDYNANVSMTYNGTTQSASTNSKVNISANATIKAKNNVYYAEGSFSGTIIETTSSNGVTDTDSTTESGSAHVYADLTNIDTDPYAYVDAKDNVDGEEEEYKYKMSYDYIEASISALLEEYASELEDVLPSTDTSVDSIEDYDPQALFDEFETLLAEYDGSKLVLSSVTKDTYTLRVCFPLSEAYNYYLEQSGDTTTTLPSELSDDFINYDFSFDVSTGLFKGFNFEFDLAELVNQLVRPTCENYVAQGYFDSYSINYNTSKIYASFNVTYGISSVNTLSSDEKANYIDPIVATE